MIRLLALVVIVLLAACTPQQVVAFYFQDHADEANDVAACESGHRADAVSPDGANHGLFQINRVHRRTFEQVTGQPWAEVYDPVHNTRFALWLWQQQGWEPWTCRP